MVKEHLKGRSWQEDELERQKQIKQMIKGYSVEDYIRIFKICKMCEKGEDRENWSLKSGLDIIFSLIEINSDFYYEVVRQYLICDAPYGYDCTRIISFLLKSSGLKKTKMLIEENKFIYQRNWLKNFWEIIPEEDLSVEYTNEFLEFVKKEALMDNPNFPMAIYMGKYKKFDSAIIQKISRIVIECSNKKKGVAEQFLGNFYVKSALGTILNLFSDTLEWLEKLYLLAFGNHFDYEGKLLLELVKRNYSFWNEFTMKMSGNIHQTSYEHNVFENIWSLDDYNDLIQIACNNMIGKYYSFMTESEGIAIFANSEKTPEYIKQRKKQWISEFIQQNSKDVKKIKMIFNIISTIFPSDRKEFLLELVNYTKDIDIFKRVPLFPISSSWSGSEVPLIDRKIDFLSDMIGSLKGFEFVEHRYYLKEQKDAYEQYKQDVLIKEYLEDEDIA